MNDDFEQNKKVKFSENEEIIAEHEPKKEFLSWGRSHAPLIDTNTTNFIFQGIDIDTYDGEPLQENPWKGMDVPGSKIAPVPIIRMFGCTSLGFSVCAHVHGFTPYFYCDWPSHLFTEAMCGAFRSALEAELRAVVKGIEKNCKTLVHAVIPVMKQSIMHYSFGQKRRMLKIIVAMPKLVANARTVLEHGVTLPNIPKKFIPTYESNVSYVIRYMVDNYVVGCNWLEFPAGTYSIRNSEWKDSLCQYELDIVYTSIISHQPKTARWSRIAPLRIFSFDIECMGRPGHFPDATIDPVIQIACVLNVHGKAEGGPGVNQNPEGSKAAPDLISGNATPSRKTVLVLGTCLPIVGCEVRSFDDERELLLEWSKLMRQCDADIMTGYNIQNFDIPYLMNRAEALGIGHEFNYLGRLKHKKAYMKKSTFESSAFGKRTSVDTVIEGRIMMDVIQYMYRNEKLSSYSLNSVSAEFLEQQKEDVHHSIISVLQKGSDQDRKRLAVYCLKDAELPQLLIEKLLILINYVEMARVTGVPITYLFTRGQQIKVLSMLYRKSAEYDMVVPFVAKMGPALDEEGEEVGYEGATVLDPIRGYYDTPIATLDFASLYPSIMQAHNLCYSSLIRPEDVAKVPEEHREQSPGGDYFVRETIHKGILPIILTELLSARKKAKVDMKNAKDPLEKAVMNGRQLALKISANSVYGFTGATVGALPCIAISASVTSFGRSMIEATKNTVESYYTIANGFPANAVVVYGDTDSVMVKFGAKDVKQAMELGLDAAARVTKIFPRPVSLEFEKVYFPYLLINKKRYAGLYWTKPDTWDKLDTKGLETVRRDNCKLVRTLFESCLKKILIDRDVDGAVALAKKTISDLLQNKIDISLLIISKSLSGTADDYKNKQPHVELAEKMRKRDPGSAPSVGDRVPYVIISAAKGTAAYLKSEDPLYVMEHNIPIDTDYYIEQQLSKPMMRLFKPIIPNPESILQGDHTRKITKVTPTNNVGLMKFAVKGFNCMVCRSKLPLGSKQAVCSNCEPKKAEMYMEQLNKTNHLEQKFSLLWTQCQNCQGSLHEEVLCTNSDCEIFYLRTRVKKDLNSAHETMERFSF